PNYVNFLTQRQVLQVYTKRAERFTYWRQRVGDYVRLLATAAMAYHAEERNTRILLQVFVADDIIVQEVLQNNKSQRTAESEKESSRIDHLPVWRHRAAADHHRLVDNTLLDDVRCNS